MNAPHSITIREEYILDLARAAILLFVVKQGTLPSEVGIAHAEELTTGVKLKALVSYGLELVNGGNGHLGNVL